MTSFEKENRSSLQELEQAHNRLTGFVTDFSRRCEAEKVQQIKSEEITEIFAELYGAVSRYIDRMETRDIEGITYLINAFMRLCEEYGIDFPESRSYICHILDMFESRGMIEEEKREAEEEKIPAAQLFSVHFRSCLNFLERAEGGLVGTRESAEILEELEGYPLPRDIAPLSYEAFRMKQRAVKYFKENLEQSLEFFNQLNLSEISEEDRLYIDNALNKLREFLSRKNVTAFDAAMDPLQVLLSRAKSRLWLSFQNFNQT